ncbi:hypothetical protein DXV76_08180 [Rhodobacteraceae bacterium CCMM004]|nr:hypothetical protein DXV76_08180 [Rhodobacteraceae bacterium CCMM004]
MTDYRAATQALLSEALFAPEAQLGQAVDRAYSRDAEMHLSAPGGRLTGPEAIAEGFYLPLRRALSHARRRDEIFIGGENRRDYGGTWVAAVTHYVGNFTAPFWGVQPSDRLAFLRAGEFYRIEGGRIAEARIILDLPDLMRQTGRFPLPAELGTEMLFPGPATHDGVLPAPDGGAESLDVVEGMLAALHGYDPDTFDSPDQTGKDGYWHPDMLWYGPAGIGSNYRWSGFVKDHRESFLRAFPDRKGGDHYCRIGDGDYAAISGWPSMTMTHRGAYLGVPPSGEALTLRVMDFYRCAGGRIMENWVLLDYMDLFAQMGLDLVERSNALD